MLPASFMSEEKKITL